MVSFGEDSPAPRHKVMRSTQEKYTVNAQLRVQGSTLTPTPLPTARTGLGEGEVRALPVPTGVLTACEPLPTARTGLGEGEVQGSEAQTAFRGDNQTNSTLTPTPLPTARTGLGEGKILASLRQCVQYAFLALCFCMSRPAFAQRNPNLPNAGSIESMGVNIHFTDPQPGEMQQIAAAGFKWVRMDFAWAGIERVQGTYDFSAYERLLRSLDKFKIRPIFILDYGNDIYQKGSPKSSEARAAFARFAAAAVTHFKGRGVLWEMWNEPNGGFWTPHANVDEYIALALETGKAIKAAEPNEPYIGPATSGMDFNFIERCFQAGLLNYWDAVSFHPYRDSAPETAIQDFSHAKGLLAQYAPKGKQIPILSGEWGYSELYPGLSLDLQSKYISREFLTDISNDLIVSVWYDWHDDGPDPKEAEHHFGTVYRNYKPKPTYLAAQTMGKTLAGMHFNKRLVLANPNDYCLLFSGPRDSLCMAAWTTDRAPHAVTLPAGPGDFNVTSNTGQASTISADKTGLHIELSDAPAYFKPKSENPLLADVADWVALPPAIWCDSKREVTHALGEAYLSIRLRKNPHFQFPVTLTNVLTNKHFEVNGFDVNNGVVEQPGTDALGWERRNPGGVAYRAALKLADGLEASQQTMVYAAHPLVLTAAPALDGKLPITIDNPTGEAITGRVRLNGGAGAAAGAGSIDITFAAGEKRKTAALLAPVILTDNGFYRIQLAFEERSAAGGSWEKTFTSPAVEYQSYESFGEYAAGSAPPRSDFSVEPDGDPKVKSRLALSVEDAPTGLPGERRKALRIDYDFDPGWKFLRLAPHGAKHEPISGQPTALGLWVYGDGSGNILNMRYVDSTGQTFQTSAGALDWKGWRFVEFSLAPDRASHWSGANDGVIHYPIAFDTVALVDSKDRGGGNGRIWVTDFMIMRRLAENNWPNLRK